MAKNMYVVKYHSNESILGVFSSKKIALDKATADIYTIFQLNDRVTVLMDNDEEWIWTIEKFEVNAVYE